MTLTSTAREVALGSVAGVIARDPDAVVAPGHPTTYVEDIVAVGQFAGREAVRGFFAELFAAVPDLELTVERVIADEEAVAVTWHAAGTFDGGSFQGIRAPSRPVSIRGVDIFEIREQAIVRNTVYYDGAEFARQVGVLPPRGSLADRAAWMLFNLRTRVRRPRRHQK